MAKKAGRGGARSRDVASPSVSDLDAGAATKVEGRRPGVLELVQESREELAQSFFDKEYKASEKIIVVGIACRSLCRALAGSLGRDGSLMPGSSGTLTREIESRLHVEVVMVHPLSDFAEVRAKEESRKELKARVWESIEEIWKVSEALRSPSNGEAHDASRDIRGSLTVRLTRRNPYFSLFRSIHSEGGSDSMLYGPLLQGKQGGKSPHFRGTSGTLNAFFDDIQAHCALLREESHLLFEWRSPPVFQRIQVAACSFTSGDFSCVAAVRAALQKNTPMDVWVDEDAARVGRPWYESFRGGADTLPCGLVFVGRECSPNQLAEIKWFRQTKKIVIPVFLVDPGSASDKWPPGEWEVLRNLPHHRLEQSQVSAADVSKLKNLILRS
ncbi:MAG TPA: hypothetical protein VGB13_01165 [Candidatus Krumholzibacteria bacterium]